MVFPEKGNVADKTAGSVGWIRKMFLPAVETASLNPHGLAEQLDRELTGQFQNHLVFFLPYRITEPSPFFS